MQQFYNLKLKDDKAELYIYGDISSEKFSETDISANDIITQLQNTTAKNIDVYINSYGGEVSQGLAIYNALKRHNAKVTTYVDSFACSIASVIAMAGDVRKMYENSLLMVHNAWTFAQGNAEDLKKAADDLEIINSAAIKAYKDVVNISEEELKNLLNNETWLTAEKALEMGFITEIIQANKTNTASANAQDLIFKLLTKSAVNLPEKKEKPKAEEQQDEKEIEKIIVDVIERLEKLEKEVLKKDEEQEKNETPKNNYMEKFLNALKK